MPSDFSELAGGLICPDDGRTLRHESSRFACPCCGRVFPVVEGRLLELLPSAPTNIPGNISASYRRGYQEEFQRPLRGDQRHLPWGAPEAQPSAWLRKRERQTAAILPLLGAAQDTSGMLLCDISAGAGQYTLAYAPYFKTVLHCDLSVDALAYACAQATRLQLDNLLFLRIDYLRPPFRRCLDRVLCLDTLIRGPDHERLLLRGLCNSLKPAGKAVIDFHNWWHNPLRRLGLLPENFQDNFSYTRSAANRLLATLGATVLGYFPFVQEVSGSSAGYARLARHLFPPTRLVYTLAPPPVSSQP